MPATGMKAHSRKPLTPAFQTEPAEPPEQLLCPVRGERHAERDSQQEKACRYVRLHSSPDSGRPAARP